MGCGKTKRASGRAQRSPNLKGELAQAHPSRFPLLLPRLGPRSNWHGATPGCRPSWPWRSLSSSALNAISLKVMIPASSTVLQSPNVGSLPAITLTRGVTISLSSKNFFGVGLGSPACAQLDYFIDKTQRLSSQKNVCQLTTKARRICVAGQFFR